MIRGIFRPAVLTFSLVLGGCTSLGLTNPPDPFASWAQDFDKNISVCVTAKGADCLATAFDAEPRPPLAADASVADKLSYDLKTAQVLLHQPDAAKLLYGQYGIDTKAYLGTGYSVPVTGSAAYAYQWATQREFFVPNLCGDTANPQVCPARDPDMWTWKLPATALSDWADKPLDALTKAVAPVADAEGFAKAAAKPAGVEMPALLVRFSSFPAKFDTGQVGRATAVRVFFASYDQVRAKTLRDVLIGTGSVGLIQKPNPDNTFFLWIYAPGEGTKAAPASWHELFDVLEARGGKG